MLRAEASRGEVLVFTDANTMFAADALTSSRARCATNRSAW